MSNNAKHTSSASKADPALTVANTDCDTEFVRPKNFDLDVALDTHIERVFKENKDSMDILAQ